jgi:hypothetical protein
MVRLAKRSGWALLAVAGLIVPFRQASAQAAPQVTAPQTVSSPAAPSKTSPSTTRSRHKKAAAVETPAAPPVPPPTLEQSAPTAPEVTFQNGQLTIDAANSTLSQVLHAVQQRTGASIEIPAGGASDRVVAQLGPGRPRDVLNTLLNGSKFDYVILGVTGNPGAVQKVILTPRLAGTAMTAQNNKPQPQPPDEQAEEGPPADTAETEYQNPDQPPPPGSFRRPMIPGGPVVNPGGVNGDGDQQNGVRTPEQVQQEMQQIQQQQMLYQQQLNQANQNQQQ